MLSISHLFRVNSVYDIFRIPKILLTDPRCFNILAFLIIVGDALLVQIIIRYVPYTEIDWETYMYQVELYIKGERDYALIEGPTGPLVYPAGHVYIHRILHSLTGEGLNIPLAQQIYGILYIFSLAITCLLYSRAGGVPNWILLLLPLSKRLHSLFVLRLFNDCWATALMQAATLSYALGWDAAGTLLYSAALSIKMSVLLYLPGILVILFRRKGLFSSIQHVLLLLLSQASMAAPFLLRHPQSYLHRAYEFTRIFLYKWTVNWRFVSEGTFLSPSWARGLLLGHALVLVAFALFKWCRKDGGTLAVLIRGLRSPTSSPSLAPVDADYVITVLWTSNLIGIVFARSLHYQFYSWYAQQLPFLAWRTKYPVLLKILILLWIEYAWNIFPSTTFSSALLLLSHLLLVIGIWFGYPEGKDGRHTKTE